MEVDSLPIQQRVLYGKTKEDEVRRCLNESYKVFNLQPSSFVEDCKEKTDCWHVTAAGVAHRCAIKVRTRKKDILAAIRDPFFGLHHEDTRVGRDMLQEYLLYITLSPDESVIRVATGRATHRIYNEIFEEWIEQDGDINPLMRPKYPKCLLHSERHPGCELWLHYDRRDGHPKILGFIPPSYLTEGKQIKYFPFIK